ncbi:MAG: class II aldolase/adducin family protein [Syntrophales bacterium]|jgi:L-fuculose-phosphate aldolase|nr:class II aldolase/adducin family protein [Syntrophales bacterium]
MRVSFTTTFTDNHPPEDPAIEQLKDWCRKFHEQGLTPSYEGSSLGNLSFRPERENNSFIITASQLELKDNLTSDAFVCVHACDYDHRIVRASGTREPSSESMLHFEIYKARSDINAIFHGHCALILKRAEELDLPVTCREEPFGSVALVRRVLEMLDNHTFIVMKNHGFLSLGMDMESAGRLALRVHGECLL